jgi:hypothetical protein
MFVGHTAIALAAKTKAPKVSLGWLVAAAFTLDLLWPLFLLLGIERVSIVPGATAFNPLVFDLYPWSHSLLMACVWGCALPAWPAGSGRRTASPPSSARWWSATGFWTGSVMLRTFRCDAPDLPLWPGRSPLAGLGLWNSVYASLLVEGGIFLAGIVLYVRSTRAVDRIGSVAFWAFMAVSAAMWAAGPWSPPPPSPRALAWLSLGGWLLVAWAGWADHHRAASVTK